jgi:hypothetical protein
MEQNTSTSRNCWEKGGFLDKIGEYKTNSIATSWWELFISCGRFVQSCTEFYYLTNLMEQSFSGLIIAQILKKFPEFHGTRRFIVVFTRFHQLSVF